MPTVGIDHIAMPTANAERLIAFYKRLGFLINNEDAWRAGKVPAFSIQVGESKINVHPEGYTASLRGPTAVPGCTDICFVLQGTVGECKKMPPQLFPTTRSKALAPETLLTPQRHASSAACPGRALPRHAVLPSTAAGGRRVLGEPPSPRARRDADIHTAP